MQYVEHPCFQADIRITQCQTFKNPHNVAIPSLKDNEKVGLTRKDQHRNHT